MDKDSDKFSIPMVGDEAACSIGTIRINHDVVANIVRLSALEVDGVMNVGEASILSRLGNIFLRNRSCQGIRVSEDSNGNYVIDIQVALRFGVELARVALDIQQNVTQKVTNMTMKSVSQVNITIERVVNGTPNTSSLPDTDYTVN
jgi:uncharacterized alkaline shock family protein YloU